MNNIEELKPCPFCGGKAHLLTSNGSFLVECSVCLTDFSDGPVGVGWYRSENDAAADWNDRPSERALIAQLEAAQKERDDLHDKFNEISTQKQFWVKCAKELESQLETAEAALSAANERLLVPVGYCIMPESLTAENGAKGALSGEFFTETHITCEECGGDCDEDDPCKHCNDLGVQTVRAAIGWSTIKDIYKMAVGATAIRQAGFTVEGEPALVKYIVILQWAWCNDSGSGIDYNSDLITFDTRDKAIYHGFKLQDSDDFNIGVLTSGVLTSFDWMNKTLTAKAATLAQIAENIGVGGNTDAE